MPGRPLVLASGSPQRRAILERLGVAFTVRVTDVEELSEGDPVQVARENALRKARAALRPGEAEAVLGCDTIVTLDGAIYGKPPDESAARATLTALGGRTHEVISGLAAAADGRARGGHRAHGRGAYPGRVQTDRRGSARLVRSAPRSGADAPAATRSRAPAKSSR